MAVNLVMIIVSILVICVARLIWKWSILKVIGVFSLFTLIDFAFLGANLHKIQQGAWIPLAFALLTSIIMITWGKGIELLRSSYYMNKVALPDIIHKLDRSKLNYVEDIIAVFITDFYDKSGGSFLHYLKLNHIMPKQALIVSIATENYPYISEKNRYEIKEIFEGIYSLVLHYGFMQTINLPRALEIGERMKIFPFPVDLNKTIYMVEFVHIAMTKKKYPRLFYWQKRLFSFLLRNSEFEIEFFHLPYNKTIAIGTYCEI